MERYESSQCVGTREVEIRTAIVATRDDDGDTEVVATTNASRNKGGSRCIETVSDGSQFAPALLVGFRVDTKLELLISDGTADHYYHGSIDPCDTKIIHQDVDTDSQKVDILAQHIFTEMEGVSLVVDRTISDDGVKVTLRQRLETGIVKLLWSGMLPRAQRDASSCFPILKLLGLTIRREQERYNTLQEDYKSMQSNLLGWKDTAEKLSRDTWQSEKDALLQNFLMLYRKTHDMLRQTKLELQQLEDRHKAAGGCFSSSTTGPVATTRRPAIMRSEGVDDHDEVLYDQRTIDRLAAGPQSRNAFLATIEKEGVPARGGVETSNKKTASKSLPASRTPAINHASGESRTQATDLPLKDKRLPETSGDRGTAESMGTVLGGISSAKELFQDLADAKRLRISSLSTTGSTDPQERTDGTTKLPNKKRKVSTSVVDEKRRRELEKMAAILGDDDDSD